MKASIYLLTLLLTCMLFLSASCTKEENSCVQKNDCNILEWKVDGKKYKAECESGPLFGCDAVDCQYYHDTKTLDFIGGNLNNQSIKLYIYKHVDYNVFIELEEFDKLRYGNSNNDLNCAIYNADKNSLYKLKIYKPDTINKLIEGEFSFTGINDCGDTTKVTDGYFKLSYRP